MSLIWKQFTIIDTDYRLLARDGAGNILTRKTILESSKRLTGAIEKINKDAIIFDITPCYLKLENLEWMLESEPNFSLTPVWKDPMIAAVCLLGFIFCIISIRIMVNDKHRELLLHAILPSKVLATMKDGGQFIEDFKYVAVLVS